MASKSSCTASNLYFSINAILTENAQSGVPQGEESALPPKLAQCFPLIFANGTVNFPFGLAQLLTKSGQNEKEEEVENADLDEPETDEEEEAKNDDNDEKASADEDNKDFISVEPKTRNSEFLIIYINFTIGSPQFQSNWLFPMPASRVNPPPPALFARLPCLPPPFGSSLVKSPMFGPFSSFCPGQIQQPKHGLGQHKRKGGQIRFSNEQTDTLESTFDAKKYLTNAERKRLAKALALSERQVKTWFQNRRAKWRRQLPAGSDCLRSPEAVEDVGIEEQPPPLTITRPSLFGHFRGLSD